MQKNQASLQKDLDARRAGSTLGIKQEPAEEPMDTSSSILNGSVNGYPTAASPSLSHANGNGGSHTDTSAQELQDFVLKTFRKHFVVTLSEFKRLLNLHLASMPVGRSLFHSISDHMLTDAIVLSHCRQILVPVSIQEAPAEVELCCLVSCWSGWAFPIKQQEHSWLRSLSHLYPQQG